MTIPQRILLHVATGAALVIAVATAVTYGIVYEGAKQRDLKHLETYVRERARREPGHGREAHRDEPPAQRHA